MKAIPTKKTEATKVALPSALDRVLAENIVADEDLPRFDKSAVDGYAVRAEDTSGASQFKPRAFKIVKDRMNRNQVAQVWTGNPIPEGANAVVMLENTKKIGNRIEVWVSLTPGENVSKKGEDMLRGKTAVDAGTRLKPQHLALIAALGKAEVNVFEKPRIAIFATGNELVEVGCEPQPAQIFDTNRLMISSLCAELGAETLDLGIAQDNLAEIAGKLKEGLRKADAIITTGGTSVGAADLVPEAANKTGRPGVVVHGVAMRPGMPTALAVMDDKPVLILSGNPVAAFVGFEAFGRPLICRMLGLKRTEPRPMVKAKITRKVTAALGRKTFVRVRVFQDGDDVLAEPISSKGSGTISTITEGNGFVVVPENREGIAEGETVSVSLFGNMEVARKNV
jgi:molybdopterin molybdotransferase